MKHFFKNLQEAYATAYNNTVTTMDNEYFDTNELRDAGEKIIANLNIQYINQLNEMFSTNFVGTDEFYAIFENLHEVTYNEMFTAAKLYNVMTITKV